MTAIAYPFLRPGPKRISAGHWLVTRDGEPCVFVDGHLNHFDYSTNLKAVRHFTVDVEGVAADTGLKADELKLLCVVTFGTGGRRLQRARKIVGREVIQAGREVVELALSIDGREVSELFVLTTKIVLLSSGTVRRHVSPITTGASLWRDEFRVAVEPLGARFPIEAVSFATVFPTGHSDALWYLDWSPQYLHHDFATSVRLLINLNRPAFVEAVQQADKVTLRMLICSVATQMVRLAIALDHFPLDQAEASPSSVLAVIEAWVEQAFPGQSAEAVRTLAQHDPARFELAIGSLFAGELGNE
ncbi:hypothetical protein [Paracoccus sp. (in: a-proteobacteria)]|uniref:hypothetical protein n=1 Tax=Paracoccus sp. TaxID=267 RepID=UPI00396CEB8E